MEQQPVVLCPLCAYSGAKVVADYLKHIRLLHADQPGFSIQCKLQGCRGRTYKSFHYYRNHVYDFHANAFASTSAKQQSSSAPPTSPTRDPTYTCTSTDDDLCTPGFSDDTSTEIERDLQRAAALWILKTRESNRLPLSTMDSIVQDVDSLYEVALGVLHDDVRKALTASGVDPQTIPGLDLIFHRNGPRGRLFLGLETQYRQLQYFRQNLRLVEPSTIVLGTVTKVKGFGNKRRIVEADETMSYIPIMETLNVLLHNKAIQLEIHRGHRNSEGFLEDYCDGEAYQSHPLFRLETKSFQLLLYFDDVELCNPLGSKRTKHKVGFFYFTLGNISPKHRSQTKNIQLVAIVRRKFIKKYGLNAVLAPMVEDIAKLEEGHDFTINGQIEHYTGTVAAVSGDNLGSNALGGFKEGSTAHRGCRQCMATPDEMATKFLERDFELRTLTKHLEHCGKVEGEDGDQYSIEYGVNFRSVLLDLKHFDICSGALVPDIMHDVLEGALQYEVKLFLNYAVYSQKFLTADHLNQLIESYELGYMEDNRPSPINPTVLRSVNASDRSLKQNASQMWLLGRLLPVMIGHQVPEDDERWQNLLLMLEVTDYLFAPRITLDDVGYLEHIIAEHHTQFVLLYPTHSVTPKMHYLVHMPRLFAKFGPLVRHWTMRYEAKHKYFKQLANNIGNFINISHTLAMRHQLYQCYLAENEETISNDLEVGPGDDITTQELGDGVPTPGSAFRAKWVKVHGTIYKHPCALVLNVSDVTPQFGCIQDVFLVGGEVYFRVELQDTLCYAEHYHAYVIRRTGQFSLVPYASLSSHIPLYPRQVEGLTRPRQKAIVLKHHISTL